MRKLFNITAAMCLLSGAWCYAAPIWTSTFVSDTDGVVDLFDGNAGKQILGAVADGKISVNLWDEDLDPNIAPPLPDKAGRPLGTTLTPADSFSAEETFAWSDMWESGADQPNSSNWHFFGFMGNDARQNRQVAGALIRQWQLLNGNYYIRVNVFMAGTDDDVRSDSQNSVSLGTTAEGQVYSISVGWDPNTNTMSAELRNNIGATVVRTDMVITDPAVLQGIELTHLGWSDYGTDNPNQIETQKIEIQVDELTYNSSYEDAYPPPPSPSMLWMSEFETPGGFDGFLNVFDKSQLPVPDVGPILDPGGALNGFLGVTTYDVDLFGEFTSNRAGRPIQTGLQIKEADSWSVLYEFQWTDLPEYLDCNEDPASVLEIVGLIGYRNNWTRELAGALLRHFYNDGDIYLSVRAYLAGSNECAREDPGTSVNLSDLGGLFTDYKLAIGYDSEADLLSVAFYSEYGVEMAYETMSTDPNDIPICGSDPPEDVLDYTLSWVGWSDYNVRGDNLCEVQTNTWAVDKVTFWYGLPEAAFEAASCPKGDTNDNCMIEFAEYLQIEECLLGPNSTPIPVDPPPSAADCLQFFDFDHDNDVDMVDYAVFGL